MTPQEYMRRLEAALGAMSTEERHEALAYYGEFLQEASEEERQNLGTPEALAARLLQENGVQTAPTASPLQTQYHFHKALWIFAIVVTFPIWFSLGIAFFSVALAVCISLLAILLGLGASALAFLAAGVILLLAWGDAGQIFLGIGGSLVCVGLLLLLWRPIWKLCGWIAKGTLWLCKAIWHLVF